MQGRRGRVGHRCSYRVVIHSHACVEKDTLMPTSNHLLLVLGLNSRCSGVGSQGISVLGSAPWPLSRYPSLRHGVG